MFIAFSWLPFSAYFFQVELTAILASVYLKNELRSRVFFNDHRNSGNAKLPDVWNLVVTFGEWEVPCSARLSHDNFEVFILSSYQCLHGFNFKIHPFGFKLVNVLCTCHLFLLTIPYAFAFNLNINLFLKCICSLLFFSHSSPTHFFYPYAIYIDITKVYVNI